MYRDLSDDLQIEAIKARVRDAAGAPVSIGTQIFGGGFSFGLENAGIGVAGHLEHSSAQLGLYPSRSKWPVVAMDETGWRDFARTLVRENLVPDVMHANTPCTNYAGTGKHDGVTGDSMCFLRWFVSNVAMVAQPDVWTWELVPPVWTRSREWLRSIAFRASLKGYKSYVFLTSSAQHGGYQNRKRFHFIASKYELDFNGVYDREPSDRKGWRPLGEALEAVEEEVRSNSPVHNHENLYDGAYYDILKFTPPGSHISDAPDSILMEHYKPRGMSWHPGSSVPGFAHVRARMDHISPNVLGGYTIFHPVENRYLTPRECATVMGFPLQYEFSPGTLAYAEIGKGLAVQTASFVGRVIRDGLDNAIPVQAKRSGDIEAHDWRLKRGKTKLNVGHLVMPIDDQIAWWRENFKTDPPDGFGIKRSKR
jgi:DNA (cytosine-5)-methyltransferase 1